MPFVFAAAIGFVADPLIREVQRRLHVGRWLAAVLIYIAFLAVLAGVGYWIVAAAASDLAHVLARAPEILHRFLTQAIGPQGIVVFGESYSPERIVSVLGGGLRGLIGFAAASQLAGLLASGVFGGFLLLVLTPYFMISGPRLAAGTIWLLPPERRPSVEALLPKLIPVLRRYLIGIFLVVVYTSTVAWIGFGPVFRLPHALLLALAVGVLELVPVIGPLVSATLVGLVAVQQTSLWGAAFLVGFAIALRLTIDNVVGPLVLGQAARVHPVVVITGFVCGAMLFGIVGLLLAVPVAVCIKTTLEHYYSEPIRRGE